MAYRNGLHAITLALVSRHEGGLRKDTFDYSSSGFPNVSCVSTHTITSSPASNQPSPPASWPASQVSSSSCSPIGGPDRCRGIRQTAQASCHPHARSPQVSLHPSAQLHSRRIMPLPCVRAFAPVFIHSTGASLRAVKFNLHPFIIELRHWQIHLMQRQLYPREKKLCISMGKPHRINACSHRNPDFISDCNFAHYSCCVPSL